jgi:type II secretory pathway pseudopilin PulG
MVEIAISLAIIGIALVAIIGVLPIGMRTQRDNREETIINQDATVFIEAIRNGARGLDDLTNYVYAITNSWTLYNADGSVDHSGVNGYTYTAASAYGTPVPFMALTNGANIVGLLSTPEFTTNSSGNFLPISTLFSNNGYSNHVVAYVRSLSGPAVEKPPQDNLIIQADAFAYRILCVNAPVARDTNALALSLPYGIYDKQLAASLRELRLTFLWPQLPNGSLGAGRQTFRTMVAGQMTQMLTITNGQWLYFYQPQSFTNVVTAQ